MITRETIIDVLPYATEMRHELHRHPEVSGHETETKRRILRELTAMGLETREFEGCCSVMGVLRNGDGPCVAIRADMDALPIREATGLPFASENDGVMHACGHDAHMALSLGSARWFSTHRDAWQGTIKWLFESEEETVGGGQRMVAQGCMEDPRVGCVIGQHMNPNYPVHTFYSRSGAVSGASDDLRLTVTGRGCHGAYPQKGVDAIVIAAQIVTALQTLVSRTVSPFDPVALPFGAIHGGQAGNVVCETVTLTGTLRTIAPETRVLLHRRMREMTEGIAGGMGGSAQMEIIPSYSAVVNDPAFYSLVEENARRLIGAERMVEQQAPSLGVESFCYFLKDAPGVYYDLGCGVGTGLHTATFRVDEAVLETGVAMQVGSALALLDRMKEAMA